MIAGVGVDIVQNKRFVKWLSNEKMIHRFFNDKELVECNEITEEFLSSRFAAKEAFVKALGTGFKKIKLKDIYVISDQLGKPELFFEKSVIELFPDINKQKLFISLSHEKDYSIAFVVIEK